VNSIFQCIEKHYSFSRETKILGKLLWWGFCNFLEIFSKLKEQTPFKEADVNALKLRNMQNYFGQQLTPN
jgi:hypothetical protein